MKTKLFEIRDSMTFIPALAIKVEADSMDDFYLLNRAGFDRNDNYVILFHLERDDKNGSYDPFSWDDRTMTVAHQYIIENFDELKANDVIDIEFILGESISKKESERKLK